MTKAELFEQETIIAEQVCGLLCACEWRGRVGLGIPIALVRVMMACGVRCTHIISDNKNGVLELFGAVRRKLLDGTNGPFVRIVTGKTAIKTNFFGMSLIQTPIPR